MNNLIHALIIAKKDIKIFLTDRLALLFFILFPFMFIVLFNFVLGSTNIQDKRMELHLVTREANGMSHQIISTLETKDESQLKPGQPVILWDKDYDQALKDVESKKIAGFIVFPEDFTGGVMMGFGTRIEVIADTESTSTRAALNNIASSIADQINTQQAAINATIGLMMENGIAINNIIIQQLYTTPVSASTPQININIIDVGNIQAENPSNYVIPGYLVMFTFFAAALAAETIVKERQNHTLERLLTCSVKKEAILGGMFMGTAARGLIQMIIFWTVAILVFKVDLGLSPEGVILLSLLVVIVSTSFGIMLATLAKTQRAASSIAILASLALAPLGGCWWPLFLTPKWMQNIAKVTPHGWATTGFNKLMVFGSDFGSVVPEMTALIIFTLIFGLIAIWRFRAISK